MRETIDVGLPPLKQPFSWMVRGGGVLYTAHGPVRPDGSIDTGPVEQQARLTLDNLQRAVESAGKTLDDVWTDIPRLAGTHAERIPSFPTQLPVSLLRRVVSCCTDPGDLVIDPFCGSGTTGAAAVGLGRRFLGVERSAEFADLARLRLKGVRREA